MTAIIRAPRPPKGWTEIPDATVRDSRLSYRARGILARLLSNADGYRMTAADLARESTDGRYSILAGLRELRQAGYLVTCRTRDSKGRIRTETYVFDFPQNAVDPNVKNTEVGSPDVGQTNSIKVNQTGIPIAAAAPRTRARARVNAREESPALEGGGAAAATQQKQQGKARRRRASGIVTWDANDIEEAQRIEHQHDAAVIVDVTERLKKQGLEPVPGRVAKEIERLERAQAAAAAAKQRAAAAHAAASPPDPEAAAKGREFISKIRARRRERETVL